MRSTRAIAIFSRVTFDVVSFKGARCATPRENAMDVLIVVVVPGPLEDGDCRAKGNCKRARVDGASRAIAQSP
ncbi:hypothetical protein ZHAS_00012659 [Anopheles sinensis]|uniref:Uncharacterized protein n=1 Tax=Anopheles sinensis TaxID=74873 RepID=A0A084W3F7_ANOSI|nr:hypothetical protein ZHAS_00012659 [Anopheles sinensis]